MKKSDLLKQKRAAAIKAQQALHDAAEKEQRSLNEQETVDFRAKQKEIEALNGEIADALAFEENVRSLGEAAPSSLETGKGEEKEKLALRKKLNIGLALRGAATGKLTGVEKEVNDLAIEEMRATGREVSDYSFNVPGSMVRADGYTVSEDGGGYGGQLVVDQAPRLVDSFIPKLFIEELGATVLTNLQGGSVPLPVLSDFDFTWADETETITSSKAAVNGPKLTAKRAGAVVLISNRLLSQSSLPVQAKIMQMLQNGAGRALNKAAIQGTGGKQPTGLLNMVGIPHAAQVAESFADWAKVLELKGLLSKNDSTENSLGYLTDPVLMAAMEAIRKDAGSGLMIAENNKIAGLKALATSLVPTIAAAGAVPELHHLICGDWSQMYVGQFGVVSFVVDPLTAAAANSLKVVVNMEADVQVANKKAFAINSFLKV